ncbi:hypothetical protein [Lichenicoccus sp.]|uniref:hypothetical protein n=1 Tax=Lichenicoccus sp. TaxID=2781899 RepID=UPI003D096A27
MATRAHTTPEVRPSRRGLLSTVGLAAVAAVGWVRPDTTAAAAPAQPTSSPDDRLITLCTQFDDLERQIIRSHDEDGEDQDAEAFRRKLSDRQHPLLRQIVTLRSTTLEGAQARARSLHLWDTEIKHQGQYDDSNVNDALLWALVRDLIGAA